MSTPDVVAVPAAPPWTAVAWVEEVTAALLGADLGGVDVDAEVEVVLPTGAARGRRSSRSAPAASGTADVRFTVVVRGGRIREVVPGAAPAATVVFTLPVPDALEVLAGTEASVLFMQGRLKVDGDLGVALAVLCATARPGFAGSVARLGGRSDG